MMILAEFPLLTIKPESGLPYSDEMLLIIFRRYPLWVRPTTTDRVPILCTIAD
jgi:hypothetical protein